MKNNDKRSNSAASNSWISKKLASDWGEPPTRLASFGLVPSKNSRWNSNQMTQDPLDQDENRFVDELCAYQAQLDQGQIHQPDFPVESKLPDEWRLTAEACRQCLDFLHETLCTPNISSPDPEQASKPIRSAVPMQIGRFEINEAQGAQTLAVAKELGLDLARLNVNGGAIALGHPLAATGVRLTVTLARELERSGQRWGISSACVGGGQGIALLIENLRAA